MAAINKNFVIKNGLEVDTNLILADAYTNKVGIGTTVPQYTLHVNGGIGVTDAYVSGIGTFVDELNVGLGGTVLTVLGVGNLIGVGTALPGYLLDIRSPVSTGQTALYVQGDIQVTGDVRADEISITNLNVSGVSTFVGFATFNNNILVAGISTFVGFSTFRSNIFVAGISTFVGFATFNDYVFIQDGLNVTGAGATLASLNVSGVSTFVGFVTFNNNILVAGIGTVTTLNSASGTITNLTGTSGTITTLGSTNGTIINLTGTSGTITNLTGTSGTITTFNSTSGTITNLTGTSGTITTFNSTSGTITNLTGTSGTITTFNSTTGNITNLTNTNLNVTGIATIATLNTTGIVVTNFTVYNNLSVGGISTFTNGPVLIGSGTSTGTASQILQVTGGAYVSGNLGIGSTNPTSALFVVGDARVTGVITATTFSGNVNAGVGTITTLGSTSGTITNLTGTSGTITTFNSTNVVVSGVTTVSAGSTSAPSITPSGDSNTGVFFPSADTIAASTGGTARITIDSSGNITVTNNLIIPLGTAALPSLAILSDPDTGIFSPGANQLAVATNGTQRLTVDTAATTSTLPVVHPLGAVGTPSITFTGDLNTGIYSPAADTLALVTAGNNTLHITSGGLVGIGTSAPAKKLEVTNGDIQIYNGDNAAPNTLSSYGLTFRAINQYSQDRGTIAEIKTYLNTGSDNDFGLQFRTQATTAGGVTTKMTLTPGGSLGIGTTSPTSPLHVKSTGNGASFASSLELSDNSVNVNTLVIQQATGITRFLATWNGTGVDTNLTFWTTTAGGSQSERVRIDTSGRLLVGTSSAFDASTVIQAKAIASVSPGILDLQANFTSNIADQSIGAIRFLSGDNAYRASIYCISDGDSSSSSDAPGRLVFSTTADGAASPTEAMRINSQQELLVGTATRTANGGKLQLSSGITFPATAVAASDANTLDDYEEGTWTPTIKRNGADQQWTATASGKYTKIGNVVYVQGSIAYTAKSADQTQYAFLATFPFTPSASSEYNFCNLEGGGAVFYQIKVVSSTGYGYFIKDNTAGGAGPLIGSELGPATGTISFAFCYSI